MAEADVACRLVWTCPAGDGAAQLVATGGSPCRMKTPITSWPSAHNRCAATLLSTPPDIANTTRATNSPRCLQDTNRPGEETKVRSAFKSSRVFDLGQLWQTPVAWVNVAQTATRFGRQPAKRDRANLYRLVVDIAAIPRSATKSLQTFCGEFSHEPASVADDWRFGVVRSEHRPGRYARSWPGRNVTGSSRGRTCASYCSACRTTIRVSTRCCPTDGPPITPNPCSPTGSKNPAAKRPQRARAAVTHAPTASLADSQQPVMGWPDAYRESRYLGRLAETLICFLTTLHSHRTRRP